MEKLNLTVISGQTARASDFNRVTSKVDAIIDEVGAIGSKKSFTKITIHEMAELVSNDNADENTQYVVVSPDQRQVVAVYYGYLPMMGLQLAQFGLSTIGNCTIV